MVAQPYDERRADELDKKIGPLVPKSAHGFGLVPWGAGVSMPMSHLACNLLKNDFKTVTSDVKIR